MKRSVWAIVILLLLTVSPSFAANDTPLTNWTSFNDAMEKAESLVGSSPEKAAGSIETALGIYESGFANAVKGSDLTKQQVVQGLESAETAAVNGDELALKLGLEFAQKTTLALVFDAFRAEMDDGNVAEAKGWFDVMANKLKFDSQHDLVKKMDAVSANPGTAGKKGQAIIDGLTAKFAGKVAEEVDEALVAADPDGDVKDHEEAAIKAAEGVAYFRAMRAPAQADIGLEETAKISGLLDQFYRAILERDWSNAVELSAPIKKAVEPLEGAETLSASALNSSIKKIQTMLSEVKTQVADGDEAGASRLTDEAWASFVKIESQIRKIDSSRYVAIEKLYAKIQADPKAADVTALSQLFTEVIDIESGKQEAGSASVQELLFTGFETIQPILFAVLALIGVYPVYLVMRAFSWKHKAWRNIALFIILLTIPVFMEAAGRLGVELQIPALQALSFTVNEYAKMFWTLTVLLAFLFAISGLRAFCRQFGVKAIGVRHEDEHEEEIHPSDPKVAVRM